MITPVEELGPLVEDHSQDHLAGEVVSVARIDLIITDGTKPSFRLITVINPMDRNPAFKRSSNPMVRT